MLFLLTSALGTILVAAELIDESSGVIALGAPVGNTELWNFTTGSHDASARLAMDGIVYVTSANTLYALDAKNGTERWRYTAEEPIHLAEVYGKVAYVYTLTTVYALETGSGREKWRFTPGDFVGGRPAVSTGIVCFNSGTSVYCLDINTGAEKWRFTKSASFGEVIIGSGILSQDLYAGAGDTFYAIMTSNGKERWHKQIKGWKTTHRASESYNNVFFWTTKDTALDGQFIALSKIEGKQLWSFTLPGGKPDWAPPPVAGNIVYFNIGLEPAVVTARDADTGTELWRYTVTSATNPGMLVSGGKVYLYGLLNVGSDIVRKVTALNAISGGFLWSCEDLVHGGVDSGPVVADGYYYFAGEGIEALNTESGTVVWKSMVGYGRYTQNLLVAGGILYVADTEGNLYAIGNAGSNDGGNSGPTGTLYVASYPSGANILIDGIDCGMTSKIVSKVPAGSRNLTLTKDGYQPYTTTVTVTAGEVKVLPPITMVKGDGGSGGGKGALYIGSSPTGATILINGTDYGKTNKYLGNVPAGSRNLTLVKEGYAVYTSIVEVPAGDLKVLKPITLTQAPRQRSPVGSTRRDDTAPGRV